MPVTPEEEMMTKLELAKRAIDDLFSDDSVSMETTKSELEELADEIQIKLDALYWDIKASAAS